VSTEARTRPPTPKRRKENPEYAEMVRRILGAWGRRVAAGDIEHLMLFREILDAAERDLTTAVAGLRGQGYSWADIGRGLGMTKQGAHRRFGSAMMGTDAEEDT
jgi:hypothetical protein